MVSSFVLWLKARIRLIWPLILPWNDLNQISQSADIRDLYFFHYNKRINIDSKFDNICATVKQFTN